MNSHNFIMKYHRMYGILFKEETEKTDWNLNLWLATFRHGTLQRTLCPLVRGCASFQAPRGLGKSNGMVEMIFRWDSSSYVSGNQVCRPSFIHIWPCKNLWLTLSFCCLIIKKIWSKATHQRQNGHKVGSSSTWMERSHQIMWYILQ